MTHRDESTFTMADLFPSTLAGLKPGVRFDWFARPPWYAQAWRWLLHVVLRRPRPRRYRTMVITEVDHEARTITYREA